MKISLISICLVFLAEGYEPNIGFMGRHFELSEKVREESLIDSEGRGKDFKYYSSVRKHLQGEPFIWDVKIYGVVDQGEIDKIVELLRGQVESMPRLISMEVEFYEKEILIKTSENTISRGDEILLFEISLKGLSYRTKLKRKKS